MGAEFFFTEATGATAREAFTKAVEEARYEYGRCGYTGTIAEKRAFKEFPLPVERMDDIYGYGEQLADEQEELTVPDPPGSKWGPAIAFRLPTEVGQPNRWAFCGWASS